MSKEEMWISPTGLLRALFSIHHHRVPEPMFHKVPRRRCHRQCHRPMSGVQVGTSDRWRMYPGSASDLREIRSGLRGFSLDIPQGEVFGFIDRNGAGKSSTFRVLATFAPKVSRTGDGVWAGCTHAAAESSRSDGLTCPTFFGVYEDLTALEYLHFFCGRVQAAIAKRRGVIDDVLALTDLTHKADSPVEGLSTRDEAAISAGSSSSA